MKKLYEKYKDVFWYLVFGVLTTIINIVSYWVCAHPLGIGTVPSTIIAWVLSVLTAYLTNRSYVFHSEASTKNEILKELVSFFAARLATGGLDLLIMYVCVDRMGMNDVVIKFAANVIVVVLNYVFSKLLIFRHKKQA